MNKNQSLLQHISDSEVETITLTGQDFKDMIGLQLPKTATNYRAFWGNSKNKQRVQSLLGLSYGYTCKVKYKERVVIFQKH